MSDVSQGAGWWEASDGRWYAPEQHPGYRPPPPTAWSPAPYPATGAMTPMAYGPTPYAVPTARCFACGSTVMATSSVCTSCGTLLGTPKDKTVAVLMAVFIPPRNWVYTYRRDASKFWAGLVVMVVGWILTIVLVGFLMLLGVWIWAILDAASKPDLYYRQFPNGPG